MPFEESLKAEVRRRAHFACCLCHDVGVEIHHIVPEADGGPSTLNNAAPLCPSCHERYGANPVKRKFITEARELWFEICDRRYAPDEGRMGEIQVALSNVATKGDIEEAVEQLRTAIAGVPMQGRDALPGDLGTKPITPESLKEYLRLMYPIVAHEGPEGCASLAADLTAIGYSDLNSLHAMVGYTSEPFADVVAEKRDNGETLFDVAGDIWPVRLFLAVLDENYCKIHYANLYERKLSEQRDYPWRRRLGEPVPTSLPWGDPEPS